MWAAQHTDQHVFATVYSFLCVAGVDPDIGDYDSRFAPTASLAVCPLVVATRPVGFHVVDFGVDIGLL
jgi:hypothetical protein